MALDPKLVHARAQGEAHLAACAGCREVLAEIRSFEDALHDPDTWLAAEDAAPRVDELRAFAMRAAAEDAAAVELLKSFESPEAAASFVWEDVARNRSSGPAASPGGCAGWRTACASASRSTR